MTYKEAKELLTSGQEGYLIRGRLYEHFNYYEWINIESGHIPYEGERVLTVHGNGRLEVNYIFRGNDNVARWAYSENDVIAWKHIEPYDGRSAENERTE